MMFATRRAFVKHKPATITAVTISSVFATVVNYGGTANSALGTVTGGVPPYTFELLGNGANIVTNSGVGTTTSTLNFTDNVQTGSWTAQVRVTDSAAQTRTSSGQAMTTYYNFSVGTPVANANPATAGSATQLTASRSNSGEGTYAWYYRVSTNGGSTYGSYTYFGAGDPYYGQNTGVNVLGEQYQYFYTYTGAGVGLTSGTVTVTVV